MEEKKSKQRSMRNGERASKPQSKTTKRRQTREEQRGEHKIKSRRGSGWEEKESSGAGRPEGRCSILPQGLAGPNLLFFRRSCCWDPGTSSSGNQVICTPSVRTRIVRLRPDLERPRPGRIEATKMVD